MKTLTEFIMEGQREYQYASGELTRLLNDIGTAAKFVNKEIRRAGLGNVMGYEDQINVQGERQKKLDVYANNQFISALRAGGQCCAITSEENEDIITFGNPISDKADYVVAIDPLDGSSNIETNVSVGTVFSILKRLSGVDYPVSEKDFLQTGDKLVAAGYVLYGSSTVLFYTTGHGVNGFTLDPAVGSFILSHPNLRIPDNGMIYSINEAQYIYFPEGVKKYVYYCQEDDKSTNRPYTTRYIGSMVADIHRNMQLGGIFIYPGTTKNPKGKLRLLYECNPMAFIVEQAGGAASNGFKRIREIQPEKIHERTPMFIGSTKMVEKAEEFMKLYSAEFSE
jgi:fructose-1,6-bisphosphatase I